MPIATTTQRQISPIPPGRYWIYVVGELAIAEFAQWVRDMSGAVAVEAVEEEEPPPLNPTHIPRIAFVIFRVPEGRAPFLNGAQFGFPNFAPPEVRSSQDVERSPTITTPLDDGIIPTIRDNLPELGAGALVLALFALLLVAGSGSR